MKKILLGTSALIAAGIIASPAAAQLEIGFGGGLEFEAYVTAEENNGENPDIPVPFTTEAEFNVDINGVSDTGIYYGGLIDLTDGGGGGNATNISIDEASIYLSGGFGTVVLGDNDSAMADNDGFVPTAGTGIIDGAGFDSFANGPRRNFAQVNTGDATKINYLTGGVAGASGVAALENNNILLGLSYTPRNTGMDSAPRGGTVNFNAAGNDVNVVEGVARWEPTFGAVNLDLGAGFYYGEDTSGGNAPDQFAWNVGMTASTGGFSFGVNYVNNGENNGPNSISGEDWGVNVGATYATGPWTFGVGYSYAQATVLEFGTGLVKESPNHSYGAGVSYALFPGMDIDADIVGFSFEDGPSTGTTENNSGIAGVSRVTLSF